MRTFDLSRVGDAALVRELNSLLGQERAALAAVLAHVAEIDARRLYLPAGYPSMFAYCVGELRMSEDAAKKRIHASRAARQFPVIFAAVAAGWVHLTGVCLLAPYLSAENADSLIAAATHRSCSDIAMMLAERFPTTESLLLVSASTNERAAQHVSFDGTEQVMAPEQGAAGDGASRVDLHRSIAKPCAADRVTLQLTISRVAYEQFQYAQSMMSHSNPGGDLAAVIESSAAALVARLEKQKFAATAKPRTRSGATPPSANPRHIPAEVRRAVCERDQGRCTFVGNAGHRCDSRTLLEFDHIVPVARGGRATVDNLRLRCRWHNQLEAARVFGAEFMDAKRKQSRADANEERESAASDPRPAASAADDDADFTACLRQLGYRSSEIRSAVAHCNSMRGATLEERVRAALKYLCPRARSVAAA